VKIEIEKSYSHGIDLFTENQLILQIEEEGIYRYYIYGDFPRKSFSIGSSCQIEEEEKSP